MVAGCSFAEYLKNKCYKKLYNAAERYTKAN